MRSGWLRGSIYRVLLFWDRFSVSKPLSQIQRRTLLFLQQASYTPSFGGLGLTLTLRFPHHPSDCLHHVDLGLARLQEEHRVEGWNIDPFG